MKMRWLITRFRVKLARIAWPPIDPLPPLFEAAGDDIGISRFRIEQDTTTEDINLRRGDCFTVSFYVEITRIDGSRDMISAQLVPKGGAPILLH